MGFEWSCTSWRSNRSKLPFLIPPLANKTKIGFYICSEKCKIMAKVKVGGRKCERVTQNGYSTYSIQLKNKKDINFSFFILLLKHLLDFKYYILVTIFYSHRTITITWIWCTNTIPCSYYLKQMCALLQYFSNRKSIIYPCCKSNIIDERKNVRRAEIS